MALLEINPSYRPLLEGLGLTAPADFLSLPAEIITGHPDRHVGRLTLGSVRAFLKREFAIPWRERLQSAWSGCGFASRSWREARMLQAASQAGIACPEWIAAGEDNHGRAFLLLRRIEGTVDLRTFLQEHCHTPRERRHFARRLGIALARLHAGFRHPDLYAKHVLVHPADASIHFLDWLRARRGHPGPTQRRRDLAALDATLAEQLASPRERLICLHAYLRELHSPLGAEEAKRWAHGIRRWTRRLLRRGRLRAERDRPLAIGERSVLWLDGEALCVLRDFWDELDGQVPAWLGAGDDAETVVPLPGGRQGLLVRRRRDLPLAWLWAKFCQRPLVSPELRRAGMLFRQDKQDGRPRLLAFGQRRPLPWRTESFLLTEMEGPAGTPRERGSANRG
jgi:tRNA A-37 threonylcarbamoyl transferase component Bud32